METKKGLSLCFALLLTSPFGMVNTIRAAQAESVTTAPQQGSVTGKVCDKAGEPLIGASVVVKGSANGAGTDIDGNFLLQNVKAGDVIYVSYIGYTPKEIKYSGQPVLDVVLDEEASSLSEVVVVGYGVQKKANLTGSVASVDSKYMEDRPMTSVSAGLQGLLPGVTVSQGSGQPGADTGTISIRGVGSLNNSSPMVIIDGIEGSMDNLDPNDIASVSVLKDAASASIYGSKAANGVILITTKRGKEGKATITYAGNFGWASAANMPQWCNSAELATLLNQARRNEGLEPLYMPSDIDLFASGTDPYGHPNTNWQDLFYKGSGFQQQHNVNVSGGAERVRYLISLGYQGQDGIIKHFNKNQYNVRTNIDANPIDRLEVNANIAYTQKKVKSPYGISNLFSNITQISPMIPCWNEDGSYGTVSNGNPIADLNEGGSEKNLLHSLQMLGSAKYTFIPGLSLKLQASYDLNYSYADKFKKNIQYNANQNNGTNEMTQENVTTDRVTADILGEYRKTFAEKHNLYVLGGFHSELYRYKLAQMWRNNFPSDELGGMDAGSTNGQRNSGYTRELSMLAWFGRVTYDYERKYLFEANIRYDASSRFAKKHRWGAFPSVSAGWRISQESFFENLATTVTDLKLRASWGMLGNQDIGGSYYPTVSTIGLGHIAVFDGKPYTGGYASEAFNPYLEWEKSTTYTIGLDACLWGKLNITLDYYKRMTSDILMSVSAPANYGLSNFKDNVGKVNNEGVELAVNYNDMIGNVTYSVGVNFAYNKNEIKSLGNDKEIIWTDAFSSHINRVGCPINSYYGYETDGLFQTDEEAAAWADKYKHTTFKPQAGDLKYVDQDGDGAITDKDRVVLGSGIPKWTYGFNLSVAYKGFDVIGLFQGTLGGHTYLVGGALGAVSNNEKAANRFWLDSWSKENPGGTVPRLSLGDNGPSSAANVTSDYWLQSTDYLRLKNLQVGYTFPSKWMSKVGIKKLRIYYSGQNLFTVTNMMKGWDPEISNVLGRFYPQTKIHSFGINLTF